MLSKKLGKKKKSKERFPQRCTEDFGVLMIPSKKLQGWKQADLILCKSFILLLGKRNPQSKHRI